MEPKFNVPLTLSGMVLAMSGVNVSSLESLMIKIRPDWLAWGIFLGGMCDVLMNCASSFGIMPVIFAVSSALSG